MHTNELDTVIAEYLKEHHAGIVCAETVQHPRQFCSIALKSDHCLIYAWAVEDQWDCAETHRLEYCDPDLFTSISEVIQRCRELAQNRYGDAIDKMVEKLLDISGCRCQQCLDDLKNSLERDTVWNPKSSSWFSPAANS